MGQLTIEDLLQTFAERGIGYSNNLTSLYDVDGLSLLHYGTCIAFWHNGVMNITSSKFTRTTSKYCNRLKAIAEDKGIQVDYFVHPSKR